MGGPQAKLWRCEEGPGGRGSHSQEAVLTLPSLSECKYYRCLERKTNKKAMSW